jgi:hypothetical protein
MFCYVQKTDHDHAIINIRITTEMKNKLTTYAKTKGSTLAGAVRELLHKNFSPVPFKLPELPEYVGTPMVVDVEYIDTTGARKVASLPVVGWGTVKEDGVEGTELHPLVYSTAPFVEEGVIPAIKLRSSADPSRVACVFDIRHGIA